MTPLRRALVVGAVARLSTDRARRVAEHVTGVLLIGVGLYTL